MHVHEKTKETSKETNGRKKRSKDKLGKDAKQTCKAQKEANKHVIKQKRVS